MSVFEEQNTKEVHQKWKKFCAISKEKAHDPFLFVKDTFTGNCCLDMLTLWLQRRLKGEFFISAFHMPVRNHLSARSDVVWCRCLSRSPDKCVGFLIYVFIYVFEQHKRQKCSTRDLYQSWTSQSQLSLLPLLGTFYAKCGTSWIIVPTTIVSPTENVSSLCEVCAER